MTLKKFLAALLLAALILTGLDVVIRWVQGTTYVGAIITDAVPVSDPMVLLWVDPANPPRASAEFEGPMNVTIPSDIGQITFRADPATLLVAFVPVNETDYAYTLIPQVIFVDSLTNVTIFNGTYANHAVTIVAEVLNGSVIRVLSLVNTTTGWYAIAAYYDPNGSAIDPVEPLQQLCSYGDYVIQLNKSKLVDLWETRATAVDRYSCASGTSEVDLLTTEVPLQLDDAYQLAGSGPIRLGVPLTATLTVDPPYTGGWHGAVHLYVNGLDYVYVYATQHAIPVLWNGTAAINSTTLVNDTILYFHCSAYNLDAQMNITGDPVNMSIFVWHFTVYKQLPTGEFDVIFDATWGNVVEMLYAPIYKELDHYLIDISTPNTEAYLMIPVDKPILTWRGWNIYKAADRAINPPSCENPIIIPLNWSTITEVIRGALNSGEYNEYRVSFNATCNGTLYIYEVGAYYYVYDTLQPGTHVFQYTGSTPFANDLAGCYMFALSTNGTSTIEVLWPSDPFS